MPAVIVRFPASITSPSPPAEIGCEAATVGEALRAAVAQAPSYGQRVFHEDRLLVTVAVNGLHVAPVNVMSQPVAAGDRIEVFPPMIGG